MKNDDIDCFPEPIMADSVPNEQCCMTRVVLFRCFG